MIFVANSLVFFIENIVRYIKFHEVVDLFYTLFVMKSAATLVQASSTALPSGSLFSGD